MTNELENLLVSGKEIDKKLVAEILTPYLRIDKDTCEIRPTPAWHDLNTEMKIILYLISRKAAVALGLPLAEEKSSATEIMQKTGMRKGTVNPALRRLFTDRLIEQAEDKKYFIPNHAVERIKQLLNERQLSK